MKQTLFIALICFLAPIVAVVSMNPEAAEQKLKEAQAWAKKTFPVPKPKPQRR